MNDQKPECCCAELGPPQFIPCQKCEPELYMQWWRRRVQDLKELTTNHNGVYDDEKDLDEIPY
jgi:hypothetical protein